VYPDVTFRNAEDIEETQSQEENKEEICAYSAYGRRYIQLRNGYSIRYAFEADDFPETYAICPSYKVVGPKHMAFPPGRRLCYNPQRRLT